MEETRPAKSGVSSRRTSARWRVLAFLSIAAMCVGIACVAHSYVFAPEPAIHAAVEPDLSLLGEGQAAVGTNPVATNPVHAKTGGLEITPAERDLGGLIEGETCVSTFTVRNLGSQACEQIEVKTSCGCSVAALRSTALAPGEEFEMPIEIRTSGKQGKVKSVFTLSYRQTGRACTRSCTATLQVATPDKLVVEPAALNLGEVIRGGPFQATVDIRQGDLSSETDLQITGVETPSWMTHVLTRQPGDKAHWDLELSGTFPRVSGRFYDPIRLQTNSVKYPTIKLPVSGFLSGEVVFAPERVIELVAGDARQATCKVRLTRQGNENSFVLDSLRPLGIGEATIRLTPRLQESGDYEIDVACQFGDGDSPRVIKGDVEATVVTDGEKESVLLPVLFIRRSSEATQSVLFGNG